MKTSISVNDQRVHGSTSVAAVYGWPVVHSLSPAMHNAALHALGLDWVYIPCAVPPEQLPAAVAAIRALGLRGVNITIPHKERLIPLLDELTPEARAIGAVNTIFIDGDALRGHNTDAAGFMRTLQRAGLSPAGKLALVLGAGGAARAVVYALVQAGCEVVLLNRTLQRAEALSELAPGQITAGQLDTATLALWAERVDLVVNATSLGMWPHTDASPWPLEVPFPQKVLLCDLVYNPRRTHLVEQATAAGARTIDGLWMLVYQGAESFQSWTGQMPDVELMYRAADQQLGGQHAAISDRR